MWAAAGIRDDPGAPLSHRPAGTLFGTQQHALRQRIGHHRIGRQCRGVAAPGGRGARAQVIAAMSRGSPWLIEVAHGERGVLQNEWLITLVAVAQQNGFAARSERAPLAPPFPRATTAAACR